MRHFSTLEAAFDLMVVELFKLISVNGKIQKVKGEIIEGYIESESGSSQSGNYLKVFFR